MEFDETYYNDGFLLDDLNGVSGGLSITGLDIKLLNDLKPFNVRLEDGNNFKIADVKGYLDGFEYYYDIWVNWYHFKVLPHDQGTLGEKPWVLDFLRYFDNIHSSITEFDRKQRSSN